MLIHSSKRHSQQPDKNTKSWVSESYDHITNSQNLSQSIKYIEKYEKHH